MAAEALKDIVSPNENRQVTPELSWMLSQNTLYFVADLKSGKRNAEIAIPRQIVMYLCRTMTDTPLKAIGLTLGGRDHSTISHGVDNVTADIKASDTFATPLYY